MRVFIAIASAEYKDVDHLGELKGTLQDGNDIESILLNSSFGDYDSTYSKLLISPTLSEVQAAINEVLFELDQIDCFTLFFAGHGISHMGTYYLCMQDTYTNRLSTSALPINFLFNVINEKKPRQTNIIIDACEAGGISGDLTTLIKPEVFGSSSSPSVSLFCACLRDQMANEFISGGVATQVLIKYMKGEIRIDNRWPYLDIVQIGRNVSVEICDSLFTQTPVVWGINLTGLSTFTKNPNFRPNTISATETIDLHRLLSSDINLLDGENEKLWIHYLNLEEKGITLELIRALLDTVKSLKRKGLERAKIGAFLISTAESFVMRITESQDVFAELELMTCFGMAFLPIIEEESSKQSFTILLDRIFNSAIKAIQHLEEDLSTETNSLLSEHTGIADLYILPIRIAKILGWLALSTKIQKLIHTEVKITKDRIRNIINKISENYSMSFCCVTEAQAPYLMMFGQMEEIKEKDESFIIPLRYYINDLIARRGKISRSNISSNDILAFLMSRSSDDYSTVNDLLAQPSELLSVLFDACARADMDEVVDPYLINIDHFSLNIFLADESSSFADDTIENGTNITMRIGSELGEGIFVLEDFRNIFGSNCISRLRNKERKPETLIAMAFASFMRPDRVAWACKHLNNDNEDALLPEALSL